MEKKVLVQQRVLEISCYKWEKFAPPANTRDLAVIARARELQKCDFGFTEITHACKNCIWFRIAKVGLNGRPLITDREIPRTEIPALAREWAEANKPNLDYKPEARPEPAKLRDDD